MGIFDRFRSGGNTTGTCTCPEHVDGLLDLVIPVVASLRAEIPDDWTVGQLIETEALSVEASDEPAFTDDDGTVVGPFQWELWVGDEARSTYDDEAPLQVDESLRAQSGVAGVLWEDREVFLVQAPTLCGRGVLAAAARALADPRVRLG